MQSHAVLTTSSSYKEIYQRLVNLTTPAICDAYHDVRLMDNDIDPMGPREQCVGRAYTIDSNQDSLSTMQALDDLQAFLAFLKCPENDIIPTILIIASCGAPYALAGGMCATVAKLKGYGGVVTDGTCRDLREIKEADIPFFAKGKCAKSGTKDRVGRIKEQIVCGGIEINPGDIILADVDGIVVMSKEEAVTAITKAEEIQAKETVALDKIKNGARFNQICNIEEHVKNIEAGVPSKLRLTI